jgi:putative tryptophan/tyrosine transport system substrate-binding protein
MRQIGLAVVLAVSLALAPLAAEGQQTVKIPRIGYLSPTSAPAFENAFRQRLRELGYVEGRNIAIEYRWAEGKYERLPELAAELVRLRVEVILAVSNAAVHAAKSVTRRSPSSSR